MTKVEAEVGLMPEVGGEAERVASLGKKCPKCKNLWICGRFVVMDLIVVGLAKFICTHVLQVLQVYGLIAD